MFRSIRQPSSSRSIFHAFNRTDVSAVTLSRPFLSFRTFTNVPWGSVRKGKQRESSPNGNHTSPSSMEIMRFSHRQSRRCFHPSRPRRALPLIPATAAILKSTSLLTVITYISRILISFIPIGTLAAFRFKRASKWLADGNPPPQTTEEAEEFYLMWCRGEKERRVTYEEAVQLLKAAPVEDGGLRLPDGRIARRITLPRSPWGHRANDDRQMIGFLRKTCFFLPPLPSASVRFYNDFSSAEQRQITALRSHWIEVRMYKDRLKWARGLVLLIFGLPIVLLLGVWVTALERTPLTGRWRLILLTPEEEDHISKKLSGQNWYKSVIHLLTTTEAPAPAIIPIHDWRWQWVTSTLRQLEAAVVNEVARIEAKGQIPISASSGRDALIRPPSTGYPIKPRPRMSSMIHSALPGADRTSGQEHLELGPPYSLMLMEKDERNAFSYGFGGKGAGGIVIYTGLLDDILREGTPTPLEPPKSFWSTMFGSPVRSCPQPTEEQTLRLACVLAHEMGHLLLSHQLETLSQQQFLWPSLLGLSMDLTRAFIWPLTFFLGPTVNDALANIGRTGVSELADKYGEIGFQWKHEYEADFAALRLLALAGFDPRAAVLHFSDAVADLHEMQPLDKETTVGWTGQILKLWAESTHPSAAQRVAAIELELDKWDFHRSQG